MKNRLFVNGVVLTVVLALAFARTASAQKISPEKERELIAIMKSDAPAAEKAIACKKLSVDGSTEAVPELAMLLGNEQLASWARTALEAIPGPAADEVLRKAAGTLQGRLLVGTINSIGVRRDAAASDQLSGLLGDNDADVASAAAVALGKIGNATAIASLRKALTTTPAAVRSAVAEGLILCAESALAKSDAAEATKIYDEVRKAEVPRQRMLEATRGAILARGDAGIPLLIEQLKSTDKGLFQIGLMTAREFTGKAVDQALATELDSATPERAALVIVAMADRNETVQLPAILKAAGRGAKPVRLAALGALGRVGDGTCLVALLDAAVDTDADLARVARESLAALPGSAIDKEIAARLAQAEGKTYPLLIELVGQRRIEATEALLKASKHSDRAIRSAALMALGNTISDKYLSVLITPVLTPASADDAAVAQAALKTAAVRMADREACATELAAAFNRAPAGAKIGLLDIIAAVGGTKALATVGAAGKSTDTTLQDASTKLLGEWTTTDAAPVLLDLAKSGGNYQTRALRGYIRIARQMTMEEPQRIQMCKNALEAAKQPPEQKLVIAVLGRIANLEALKVVAQAAQNPAVKEEAAAAAKEIGDKLPKTEEVKQLLTKAGVK